MKKLLLSALALSAFAANAQTVKKVILHDYTGVNCQFCTDGTVKLEALAAANPTNFIPVQIHAGTYTPAGSPLRTTEGSAIDAMVGKYGYPCGTLDMTRYPPANDANWTGIGMNRGAWAPAFNVQKALTAVASISINNRKKTGPATYEADVVVQFNAVPSGSHPVTLNVFILEDSIKATKTDNNLRQINYQAPSPLTYEDHGYMHNNVLRKVLFGAWGKTISNITATTKHTEHITFTVDTAAAPVGMNRNNIRIVAFIAYNGPTQDDKSVLNGEMLSVSKTFFPSGVNEVVNNVEIMSAYPNPAKIGSVVNIEYNITTPQLVTMNVYNMAGQKVATPFVSNEVEGGHTIMWKTGLTPNLVPGTYIVEVATAEGRQTQRITLQ